MRTLLFALIVAFSIRADNWTEQLVSIPLGNNYIGRPISMSGNTAVIANHPNTEFSVLVKNANTWNIQQTVSVTTDYPAGISSLSIDGDTIAAGAAYSDNRGYVHVFVRNGGVWTKQQHLMTPVSTQYEHFGGYVSLNGDTLAVSAPQNEGRGAVYVFRRTNSTWTLEQKICPDDIPVGGHFGAGLAVRGNVLVAGTSSGLLPAGRSYVYSRTGSSWILQQVLNPPEPDLVWASDVAVSVGTNAILLGIRQTPGFRGVGLYYTWNGSSWVLAQRLIAPSLTLYSSFAMSAALCGNTAVLGDQYSGPGAIYVYMKSDTSGWVLQSRRAPASEMTQLYGAFVACDGNQIAASAAPGPYFVSPPAIYPITLSASHPGIDVTINNGPSQPTPVTIPMITGEHTITWPQEQVIDVGSQYSFRSWSDSTTTLTRTIQANAPATYTANYKKQYRLTMQSAPVYAGTPSPANGFYDEGSALQLSAPPASGAVFTGWTGSAYTGTNPSPTITVNGPTIQSASFSAPALPGLGFVPVSPCRIIDTRFAGGPVTPQRPRDFIIPASPCRIPSGAYAYS